MVSNYNHPLRHPDRPWASSIRLGTALRCFFGRRPRRSTEARDGLLCVRTACPHARAHSACSMRCHTAFASRSSTVYDRTNAYRLLFPAQTSGLSHSVDLPYKWDPIGTCKCRARVLAVQDPKREPGPVLVMYLRPSRPQTWVPRELLAAGSPAADPCLPARPCAARRAPACRAGDRPASSSGGSHPPAAAPAAPLTPIRRSDVFSRGSWTPPCSV